MMMLWVMCGIAVVALGLIAMVGGNSTRSLDDVYARRDARLAKKGAAPAPASAA